MVQIEIEAADSSKIITHMVDEWDMVLPVENMLKFQVDLPVRIYSPVSSAPSLTETVMFLNVTEAFAEGIYLEGAVFRLYRAQLTDEGYVQGEFYRAADGV